MLEHDRRRGGLKDKKMKGRGGRGGEKPLLGGEPSLDVNDAEPPPADPPDDPDAEPCPGAPAAVAPVEEPTPAAAAAILGLMPFKMLATPLFCSGCNGGGTDAVPAPLLLPLAPLLEWGVMSTPFASTA